MDNVREARVLVVDDERALADVVASYLKKAGFATTLAHTGPEAVVAAEELDPDVVILDLGLPGMDGVEVCRQLRTFSSCYVLMLTARADEVDMLIGLAVGADDYVTKPFSARALVARVRTLLRRPRTPAGATAQEAPEARVFGDLTVDVPAREVRVAGSLVALTRTEYDLLEALSGSPRIVFTRQQLLDRVWKDTTGSAASDEHLVDIHVGHLRRKLGDDPRDARYVLTVRGVGYRMGPG